MRGTAWPRSGVERLTRFIPACAGNRTYPIFARVRRPVHPRVCGEQIVECGQLYADVGSSPRVRGTVSYSSGSLSHRRFIPACAGNSATLAIRHLEEAVHPRVCGEQSTYGPDTSRVIGSSPRVRGTGDPRITGSTSDRFIPACAGNRSLTACMAVLTAVHPRVCGEQAVWTTAHTVSAGSSPRVRGTVITTGEDFGLVRFIPACAGNRIITCTVSSGPTVHPRVCGEQQASDKSDRSHCGSSPRVRGTVDRRISRSRVSRFIPACAGNRPTIGGY